MATIWDNLKKLADALQSAGSAAQQTQQNIYTAATPPQPVHTTQPATSKKAAGTKGSYGYGYIQDGVNKIGPATPYTYYTQTSAPQQTAADAVFAAYAAAQAQQERLYKQQDEIFTRQKQLAKQQYDEGRALLEQQNQKAKQGRDAALADSLQTNRQNAEDSLRAAYTAYMLSGRNLPQQLKAMGISGGGSETTLADLNNNYMNSRYGITKQKNAQDADALQAYNKATGDDYADFISALQQLEKTYRDKLYRLNTDRNSQLADRADAAAKAGTTLATQVTTAAKQTAKTTKENTGYILPALNIAARTKTDLYNQLIAQGIDKKVAREYVDRV